MYIINEKYNDRIYINQKFSEKVFLMINDNYSFLVGGPHIPQNII